MAVAPQAKEPIRTRGIRVEGARATQEGILLFKRILTLGAALLMATSMAACTTTQKSASAGAVAGAVIGGATTGTFTGAAVGATVGGISGAVAGELLGRYDKDPTQCVWQDRYGERYLAPCSPNG